RTDTPPTQLSTLSLHDALPIYQLVVTLGRSGQRHEVVGRNARLREEALVDGARVDVVADRPFRLGPRFVRAPGQPGHAADHDVRSEEHTSELQSRENLVCRLLL